MVMYRMGHVSGEQCEDEDTRGGGGARGHSG